MKSLTRQEEDAMLIIWHIKEGFIKDFLIRYNEPLPPYTTLASIVKNLERKGFLAAKRYGNTYQYAPIVKEEDYIKFFMSRMVKNYFSDSYKELVSFFINEKKLSKDELKDLIHITGGDEKVDQS
jgi:Predicted transcriptional regulator